MTKMLFIVPFLVGILVFIPSVAPAGPTCGLNFARASPPPHCFPEPQGELTISQCCYSLYSTFVGVLANNTNATNGQLFLNASEEAPCEQNARNLNLTSVYCDVVPALTADTGPCLFDTTSKLEANLSNSPVTLNNLSASCANVQQESGCLVCQDSFNKALQVLVTNSGNVSESAYTNCGAALLVSLTSRNISQLPWRYALDSCLEIPFTPVGTPEKSLSTNGAITILASILGVVVCLLLASLVKSYRVRTNPGHIREDSYPQEVDQMEHGEQPANEGTLYEFSAKELERATGGFNEKNFIGEGSAGRVYKGALPSGQLVAIKAIKNETKSDTFYKEIENLSRVRHPNLVSLIGYCQTADQNLLVYEYCSKGNLSYHLFGAYPPGYPLTPPLTWSQRLNIALGSSRGLMYLHMNPGGYIVHRDIKGVYLRLPFTCEPTNILLTESYEAKVSDFGLSRFITLDESRVFTEVKGTAGYLDPEYVNQGTLTFSSDVYSFGVVLLQLISGRRPIDMMATLPFSLIKMANMVDRREADLSDFVDPRLEGAYSELSCLKVIEIAVQCTLGHGVYRPSMIEVRQYLEEAWVLGGYVGPYSEIGPKEGKPPHNPHRGDSQWKRSVDERKDDQGR